MDAVGELAGQFFQGGRGELAHIATEKFLAYKTQTAFKVGKFLVGGAG